MDDGEGPAELLERRPELEPTLRAVLAADEAADTWTFEDVSADTGPFGELVSRGIVERVDGGYRLADPAAVTAALEGAANDGAPGASDDDRSSPAFSSLDGLADPSLSSLRAWVAAVDRRAAAGLALALGLVVALRANVHPSVFRDGYVVLSANDPYAYRYWVEGVAARAGGPFDLSVLASLEPGVATGEPLFVATLWFVSALLGGGGTTIGTVMAWYPVVSALVTGLLVYALASVLTDDRRVAILSVVFLAVVPIYADRTALGFADHHAFDYPLLVLTALSLAVLVRARSDDAPGWRRSALATGGLALGVAGQVLAWEGGPLLLVPIALFVPAAAVLSVRTDTSPLSSLGPIAVALALAGVAIAVAHFLVAWHSPVVVAVVPLLFFGTVATMGIALVFHRRDLPAAWLAGLELLVGVVGLLLVAAFLPDLLATLLGGIELLLEPTPVFETTALALDPALAFDRLGPVGLVAIPALALGVRRVLDGSRTWLVPVTYGCWFLALAAVEARFAAQFSLFGVVFAAIGPFAVAGRLDPFGGSSDVPDTDGPTGADIAAVVALVALLAAPSAYLVVSSLVLTDNPTYETMRWIDSDADERDLAYPENYVLSRWDQARLYNYFVNGESESYDYAREHYRPFLTSRSFEGWYERFDGRAGYVVVRDRAVAAPPDSLQARLSDAKGGYHRGHRGSGHYRATFAAGGRTVFTVVPGATIRGTGPPNTTLKVATEVSLPTPNRGVTRPFTYGRLARTGPDGEYSVRVAYPGRYGIGREGANWTANVTARDVREGGTVRVGS